MAGKIPRATLHSESATPEAFSALAWGLEGWQREDSALTLAGLINVEYVRGGCEGPPRAPSRSRVRSISG
jgi:hypothetical protein